MADNDKTQDEKDKAAAAASSGPGPDRATQELNIGGAVRDDLAAGRDDIGGGVLAEAADNLIAGASRSDLGLDWTPPERDEDEQPRGADKPKAAPRRVGADPLAALGKALREHVEGEPLTVDMLNPIAPGQTERGWSPEVTARHPVVRAAVMAELAGTDGPSLRGKGDDREHFVDPTDREALEAAIMEDGFTEIRQRMLRNKATRVASDRLAAAQGEQALRGPAARLALAGAVEQAHETARGAGHDIG